MKKAKQQKTRESVVAVQEKDLAGAKGSSGYLVACNSDPDTPRNGGG